MSLTLARNHVVMSPVLNIRNLETAREAPSSPRPRLLDYPERRPEVSSRHRHPRYHRQPEGLPSPPLSQDGQHQKPTYDHTTHSHTSVQSRYQLTSTPGLPSARTWPHLSTLADRWKMDDDLLGVDSSHLNVYSYAMTARIREEDFDWVPHSAESAGRKDGGPSGGVGAYGMTSYDGCARDAVVAWKQDESSLVGRQGYSYDFVNSIDDVVDL